MAREIDTRNFSFGRSQADRADRFGFAAENLSATLPETQSVRVSNLNALTGTPSVLLSIDAPSAQGSLVDEALAYVTQTSEVLGFAAEEPAEFVPDPSVLQTSAGNYAVHLHQYYHGVPVFQMARTVRFTPERRISEVVGESAPIPAGFDIEPKVHAVDAVRAAAQYVAASGDGDADHDQATDHWGQPLVEPPLELDGFEPLVQTAFALASRPTVLAGTPFDVSIPAHLVVFYRGDDIRLGWHVTLTLPEGQGEYAVIVAADQPDVEILYCKNLLQSAVGGNVVEQSPALTPRRRIAFPRDVADYPLPPLIPPLPNFPGTWCDSDATEGNNVIATKGASNTVARATDSGANVEFDPPNEDEQKIVNIFYFCNYMHDFFYLLGFNEDAGNFQRRTLNGGGLPGDPVRARAHPGTVNGTANMRTFPDGQMPEMNMGLVASTGRHTAFDADVVFHEYVHGVTNRLVGGRMNAFALQQPQSAGEGEGWGDYFALTIQNFGKPSERVVTGNWVTNNPRGIRGFPYDENFPDHFGHIGRGRYTQVHDIGEIWCATLMHMNRRIGAEVGSPERGHQIGWQIVVDSLKLMPANPSFLDARDATLRALDDLHTGGKLSAPEHTAARRGAWTAFARFGMGPNANSVGASLEPTTPDFSLPGGL